MIPRENSYSHAHYVRALKSRLPAEAFAPSPKKLCIVAAHLAIISASYTAARHNTNIVLFGVLCVVIGHSTACLGFLAHELSHGAIVRNRSIRYPLEVLLWGLNAMPATMWLLLHNYSHHVHGNTSADPDRNYIKSELETPSPWLRRWYSKLFFPHQYSSIWNPLVWLHFVTYIIRHLLAVWYPDGSWPSIVTHKPSYTRAHRFRIVLELVFIELLQFGIYWLVGLRWQAYVWVSPIALLFTSTFVMAYIWTNHNLHGLFEIHDPVASSTYVAVHPKLDRRHSKFSYHTEHHIFPSMNSDFYPIVSKVLREIYPDRYQRLPIKEAWRRLFQNEPYIH